MGDSYSRTLLSGLLYWLGIFDDVDLAATEYPQNNISYKGNVLSREMESWSIKNFTMAMRFTTEATTLFETCLNNKPDLVLVTSLGHVGEEILSKWRKMVDSKVKFIFMSPHAWSGDLFDAKRSNIELESVMLKQKKVARVLDLQYFDFFRMSFARLNEATDGSHFVTASREKNIFLLWETLSILQLFHEGEE